MKLAFRIFAIDQLSDISFANDIYIIFFPFTQYLKLFKHKPPSSKTTNIQYIGHNSLSKFIIDVSICKTVFRVFHFLCNLCYNSTW